MRDSRFVVILIIIAIFVIIGSVFFFVRGRGGENNGITSETIVVQDAEVIDSGEGVLVDKQIQDYDENSMLDLEVKDKDSVFTEDQQQQHESNTANNNNQINIQQANIPQIPTLVSVPFSTNKDSENVEIKGEANTEIFVNDWSVGFLDTNGRKTISLNTAGGDGDKSFAIFLRNQVGKSGVLNLVIKKVTTSVTSSNSTSVGTTTSATSSNISTKKTWIHVYTNKEKFDINKYSNYDELKLRDVCKSVLGSYSYCYKTSSLGDKNNESLGDKKCPSSCRAGQTCLLWNSEEKSSGSLYSWVAMYRCE